MAIQVSGTNVVDNNRKGIFTSVAPGTYTNSNRPGSPSAGDMIYNSTEGEIQFWDGSQWVSGGGNRLDAFYGETQQITTTIFPSSAGFAYVSYNSEWRYIDSPEPFVNTRPVYAVNAINMKGEMVSNMSLSVGSGSYGNNTIQGAVLDSNGNVYLVVMVNQDATSFTIKFDSNKQPLWSKTFEIGVNSNVYGMVLTSDDDVVELWERQTYDGSCITKFDSDGTWKWGRRLNGSTSSLSIPGNSAINASDEMVVASCNSYYASIQQMYVGGTGNPTSRWGRQTSNLHSDASGIGYAGIDDSRNCYHLIYALGASSASGLSSNTEIALTKFNSSGTIQWQKKISTPPASGGFTTGILKPMGLGVDRSGNSYCFASATITDSSGIHAGFIVVKMNSSGSHVWTRRFITPGLASIPSGNYAYQAAMSVGGVKSCGNIITANIYTSYRSTYSGGIANESLCISLNKDGDIPGGGGSIGSQCIMLDSSAAPVTNITIAYGSQNTFASFGSSVNGNTFTTNTLTQGGAIPGQTRWDS